MPFVAKWKDLKINMLSEVSQKKTNINHLYVEFLKIIQMNLYTKQDTHRHRKVT